MRTFGIHKTADETICLESQAFQTPHSTSKQTRTQFTEQGIFKFLVSIFTVSDTWPML